MPILNNDSQQGFSIVEMVVAIVVIGILATGFISAFSSVLRTSASPLQTSAMEYIAASQMDKVLSGSFLSAVNAPAYNETVNVDGTDYFAVFQSALITGVTADSGVHVTVTISTELCASCVALFWDAFNVK